MKPGQLKEVIKSEYKKCAKDPIYFLKKYCVVQHPIKGKVPFHLWSYQEEMELYLLLGAGQHNTFLKSI